MRGEVTDHYGISYSGTQLETADTDKALPTNAQQLLLLGEVLFQRFAVTAHGRRAAVSAGYPDHGCLALFGNFLPEFRLVLHVGAFD